MTIDVQLRDQLAREFCSLTRDWTMGEIVNVLGVHPARVSELRRGKLTGYSIARLLRWIGRLGYDVEVVVRRRRRPPIEPARPTATVVRKDHG
jgi:predicted XRE-type DNA-binding protein